MSQSFRWYCTFGLLAILAGCQPAPAVNIPDKPAPPPDQATQQAETPESSVSRKFGP